MRKALFLASKNKDKIAELRSILESHRIALHSMLDFPEMQETLEDRDSIFGNAMKKAIEGAQYSGMRALADDTGLFVEALAGIPGVLSARYAGAGCSYKDNVRKLLSQMQGISNRKAYFETAVALADKSGIIGVVSGIVRGEIAESERGEGGFGYDSIFIVEGTHKTYAEMPDYQKNLISHRALAIEEILPLLLKNY
ncbi:MAG: RdgB/HAM1 family non-canonical purine NTP pyrophosphatase [Candidatus Cloacimonetes bacterium]|nr:RdgB/HAM1 family non-canonical purine NTP pyrophosphatase [Candidatus Cloacimonadota bacterium]